MDSYASSAVLLWTVKHQDIQGLARTVRVRQTMTNRRAEVADALGTMPALVAVIG